MCKFWREVADKERNLWTRTVKDKVKGKGQKASAL